MNKTVLLTGASTGIGLVIARHLVEQGFNVVGTAREPHEPQTEKFKLLSLDVRSEASVKECVAEVFAQYGGVDILINNAAYALVGSAEETEMSQLQSQFDTNFYGTVRMIKEVLPHMRKQRQGQIINMSSVVGFAAIPFLSAYSASKFALEGYSEALYHELLPLGINVSVVQPGLVKTSFFDNGTTIENSLQEYSSGYGGVMNEISTQSGKGIPASLVAEKVVSLCRSSKPPLINTVGHEAKLVARLKRFMPKLIFNRLWQQTFALKESG